MTLADVAIVVALLAIGIVSVTAGWCLWRVLPLVYREMRFRWIEWQIRCDLDRVQWEIEQERAREQRNWRSSWGGDY